MAAPLKTQRAGDHIQVLGAQELRREFRTVKNKAGSSGLRQAHKRSAEVVAKLAEPKVPRGATGRLANSVKATASQSSARVKAGSATRVPYAPPIHWGWPARNIPARPFLWDARNEALDRGTIEEEYKKAMDEILKVTVKGHRGIFR